MKVYMQDEQTTMSDTEVLIAAARMLESLARELLEASAGNSTLFSFKSAGTLSLVSKTLRTWASELQNEEFVGRLVANEAVLTMVRPNA